ncbi:MAG TPA: DUF3596 domain-containing protein [Chiayiivirga sp.]|nr:DUF3596 domain-containing protein [Chiayiivirga sp.]
MSKVRARPETRTLYLDFFFQGVRCREQTALPDTAENRRRVQMLLNRIEKEIKQGSLKHCIDARALLCTDFITGQHRRGTTAGGHLCPG